ncbi:Ulp1 protease family [Forsythia ovata]|uniref:Ulp1 protease family n=1 Tax=Forsythia ovata TaxID=205694 RepID=A0ABD1QC20_9LAMI
MRSIDALQSKHEQLVSDQFTMKMEIHNLFTDFAKSIVDGIQARSTTDPIQDSRADNPGGMSKKRRTMSGDNENSDDMGHEINASASISLLDDEIVLSEEDFRHIDESVERYQCRTQKRHAKLLRVCSGDCGIFVIKFAEYIAENKIQEMPKNFDTRVARLNMATQLYKFACEKPYLNISG